MEEFVLIAAVRKMLGAAKPPILVGAGDDAAVLAGSRRPAVVTTDTQIDGVHFRREWLPPRGIADRAVAITLSDLAAMGARPKALFAALNLPRSFKSREAGALSRGLHIASRQHSCPLAGGNVAVYDGPLSLTLTALGEMPPGRKPFLRSAAVPGQAIYATGMPGLSRIGLEALLAGKDSIRSLRPAVKHYLRPHPCFEEIEFLAEAVRLGAVIDVSDGLAGDLGHILEESDVGAELTPEYPVRYRNACAALGLEPESCLLGSSDDYELVVTAPAVGSDVLDSFRSRFGRKLVCLGYIRDARGLWMCPVGGRRRRVSPQAYEHRCG